MNRPRISVAGPVAAWVGISLSLISYGCSQTRDPEAVDSGGETGAASTTGTPGTTTVPGSSSSGEAGSSDDGVEPPRYDVGAIPDAPSGECGGGAGGEFSFIWIANSSEGTISKIDTITMEEVGRYRTGPGSWEDPSRTSVSLNGNVAVANRNGGVSSFFARRADCVDRNDNGMIDTSSGSNDVLPWADEECRAWYAPFEYGSQRPVAWAPGDFNPSTCTYSNEKLWTSGAAGWEQKPFPKPGPKGGDGSVDVILIDGESGDVDELVTVEGVPFDGFGLYGAAVDGAGNFWGSQLGTGSLVRVDRDTLEPTVYSMGANGYGMTVDHTGNVWVCSYDVGRFDPQTESWQTATVGGSGGCMEDGEGTLWLASNPLIGIDIETLEVVQSINLPSYVHGVSVDFQGNVWGVTMMESQAFRVNPSTGDIDTFTGLNGPYTYSDMTGFALANAGGWEPAG